MRWRERFPSTNLARCKMPRHPAAIPLSKQSHEDMPARGPVVLTEDEAELVLDMIGPPASDENPLTTQLRSKLRTFLQVRKVSRHFFFRAHTSPGAPDGHGREYDGGLLRRQDRRAERGPVRQEGMYSISVSNRSTSTVSSTTGTA